MGRGKGLRRAHDFEGQGPLWRQLDTTNETNGGTTVAGARCIARGQRGGLLF
ncbi:MAG: hypothetical protein NBV68_05190 [Erythrobacter sp.]|nr:hypothetical protein [Erythrobacter sp.]